MVKTFVRNSDIHSHSKCLRSDRGSATISYRGGLRDRRLIMRYGMLTFMAAAISSSQVSAGELQSVYVAPGGVYIANARVYVAPGPGNGEAPYVAPGAAYGAPGYGAPGYIAPAPAYGAP